MDLSEVWIWYCEQRSPAESAAAAIEVSPMQAIELFWTFHPLLTPRMDAIHATPYDTAFDDEADGALAYMARYDAVDRWEELSAGAWRVIAERLTYSQVVAMANHAAGTKVIARLPRGLDEQSQARALLLLFLLNGARTIDRRLLPKEPDGSLPMFPASQTLRRQ